MAYRKQECVVELVCVEAYGNSGCTSGLGKVGYLFDGLFIYFHKRLSFEEA
jgi:hypothetical protein